jgi:hypothetical protein
MMAGGGVPLIPPRQLKLTASASGDQGEDLRPMCHKVSILSLATPSSSTRKVSLYAKGALPDVGLVVIRLFFRHLHGGGQERLWKTFW